jgi:hypothetical protein
MSPAEASPFPGMDPYLEDPALWPEFHRRLVDELHRSIVVNVVPDYRLVVHTRRYSTADSHGASEREEPYIEIRRHDGRAAKAQVNIVLQGKPTLDYSRDGLPPWDYAVTLTRQTHLDRFEIYTDYRKDPPVPLSEENGLWLDALLISQGLREQFPHEEVAATAYSIWQAEGCPYGRDKEHWLKALAQLRTRGGGP